MNHKLIISRVALSSAILLSTVAGPAISNASNASNTPKTASFQTLQKVILGNTSDTTKTISVVNSFTNPLDLAKKYAPDTLSDWEKTIDQYDKTIGASMKKDYVTLEATSVDSVAMGKVEISEAPISFTMAGKTSSSLDSSNKMVKVDSISIKEGELTQTGTASALVATTSAVEVKDADMAFIRAEIELAKAVQAKDSAAIKQSLGMLLVQYKLQISEWEAAN